MGSLLGTAVLGCSADPDGAPGFYPTASGGTGAGGDGGSGGGGLGGQTSAAGASGSPAGDGGVGGSAPGGVGGTGGANTAGSDMGGTGGEQSFPAPDCDVTINVTITRDHDHALDVTLADIMAAVPKSYNTQGGSEHPHWIQFSSQDFLDLQAGMVVRKATCNDGHEHEYIVSCSLAPEEESPGIFADLCFPADQDPTECGAEDGDFCPDY